MLEKDLLSMPIEALAGLSFKCKCGKRHEIKVKMASLIDDAYCMISSVGKKMGGYAHVVYDAGVDKETREKIAQRLDKTFKCVVSEFCPEGLVTKEYCDQIMGEAPEEATVIICVGGTNVCEYGKYASAISGRQWIFLCLFPDGDNFADDFARLYDGKIRRIFDGCAPAVLLCDTKLGYPYAIKMFNKGLALAARSILTVFDAAFAAKTQGGMGCDVINYVLTNCVSEAVKLLKKEPNKASVRALFDLLIRISLVRSLSGVKTAYLTGINAFSDMLAGAMNMDESSLASASAYVLSSVYKDALQTDFLLTPGKDCLKHCEIILRLTGEDCDVSAGGTNEEAFKNNRERFAASISTAAHIMKAVPDADKNPVLWDQALAHECLTTCSDIYAYGGLLSWISDNGLLD